MKDPKAQNITKVKSYTVSDLGNGYPVKDTKLNKPTKQRGSGAAVKGYTSHGPMGGRLA
jgi:hypothetical protein